jgi:4-amino-4-deoxy-L-arabinose transferase-like glycosyltransferase
MMPASLPMPYHNANPLFPTLTAALSLLTGANVFHAGFIATASSSVILLVALVSLVRPHVPDVRYALGIAVLVVAFPPVLVDSFRYLSDALCAALVVAFFAIAIRASTTAAWICAGVMLGLAWLTRGAVIAIAPALLVYVVLRFRPAVAAIRLAQVAAGVLVVASPWLLHTKAVWGSYLRSDASYSIVQDFATEQYGSVVKYRHATEVPPTLTAFVMQAPAAAARRVAAGTIKVTKRTLGWWSLHSVPIALLMAAGFLTWCLNRRRLSSPEGIALAVFGVATLIMLAILGDSFEERYVHVFTVLYALFSILGCWQIWQRSAGRRRALFAIVFVVVWAVLMPINVVKAYRYWYATDPALVSYRAAAAEVDRRFARGTPVVVGLDPYFYSIETFTPSINFPDASDEFLFRVMDKYGARHVFLTNQELELWRPAWRSPSNLPPGLRLAGTVGDGFVFARRNEP